MIMKLLFIIAFILILIGIFNYDKISYKVNYFRSKKNKKDKDSLYYHFTHRKIQRDFDPRYKPRLDEFKFTRGRDDLNNE